VLVDGDTYAQITVVVLSFSDVHRHIFVGEQAQIDDERNGCNFTQLYRNRKCLVKGVMACDVIH